MYIHTPKKILMHKSERSELSIFFNRESIAQTFVPIWPFLLHKRVKWMSHVSILNTSSIPTVAHCLKITQNVPLEFWHFHQFLSY